MQTVYLLKDCYKSYNALKKLYNYPDLSTNIIIVNKEHAKILLLDKRVKNFPFIINTLPSSIGLIPKFSKVLPLEMFMMLKKFNNSPGKKVRPGRTIHVPTGKTIHVPTQTPFVPERILHTRKAYDIPVKNRFSKPKQLIRTVKETDGSVNIILNK
jgi:hypothetical protein